MKEEKTEQPTPKKLRDARNKGQVAKSKEICSAAMIVGLFIYLWAASEFLLTQLKSLILMPARFHGISFEKALIPMVVIMAQKAMLIVLPFVIAGFALGFLSNFLQVGGLFSIDPIKPDMKKMNPVEGFKRIFSLSNLMELLKSIFKIIFLGVLLCFVLIKSIDVLIKIPFSGLWGVVAALAGVLKIIILACAIVFILVAIADHFLQKYLHVRKLKMTKDEVKREFKEMEGDPVIKGKRKQLHQELAMGDTAAKVKKASVVVTNPTRLAIALMYDKEQTKLPVVSAMGENLAARIIVNTARENNVPVLQNIPLAWSLFETADVDTYIPSELIEPVAEVLRWVKQLSERNR